MAVQAHGQYIGLIWDRAPELCALFDSPDRHFGTKGHVLGLLAPGPRAPAAIDGKLFPLEPLKLDRQPSGEGLGNDHRRSGSERRPGCHAVSRAQGLAATPIDSDPGRITCGWPHRAGWTLPFARATWSDTRSAGLLMPIRPPMPPG